MGEVRSKSQLSSPRARLIGLMQHLAFGRIENLTICSGEPILNPPPCTVRSVKFSGENGPRRESILDDFALKAEVRALFAQFDAIQNGTIRSLEVKHGLPFGMQVEEVAA